MKVSISGNYTEVGFRFDVMTKTKNAIAQCVEKLLADNPIPIKATILEIWLRTDGMSEEQKVVILNQGKGKYWSVEYWLPYLKIVQNGKVDLDTFIDEFFTALQTTLSAYSVTAEAIEKAKTEAKKLIVGREEYNFELKPAQQAWRKKVAELQDDKAK